MEISILNRYNFRAQLSLEDPTELSSGWTWMGKT